MIPAVISLGGIGLLFAIGLGVASKIFYVEVDPKIEEVIEALPGANCGACGYAGCKGYAEAVGKDSDIPANLCTAGGEEIAHEVGRITGKEVSVKERRYALIRCRGTRDKAEDAYTYDGILDCKAATLIFGGNKACSYGCLGLGSCVRTCPFGAIKMGENGIPEIDAAKCTGCGVCVGTCPKGVIELVPDGAEVFVLCSSKDKGAVVKRACQVGCIGCKLCEKACEDDAICVEDNLAGISYDKCTACGKCVEKCPTDTIIKL